MCVGGKGGEGTSKKLKRAGIYSILEDMNSAPSVSNPSKPPTANYIQHQSEPNIRAFTTQSIAMAKPNPLPTHTLTQT